MCLMNFDIQLEQVSFEVPRPFVVVRDDGLRVLGHHGHWAGSGFAAERSEMIHDSLIHVMVVRQAMDYEESLYSIQIRARAAMRVDAGTGAKQGNNTQQEGSNFHRVVISDRPPISQLATFVGFCLSLRVMKY